MAIRTVHQFPSDLPHVRLYLDDIEEISSILQDAAYKSAKLETERVHAKMLADFTDSGVDSLTAKRLLESKRSITPPDITYTIGDTKMDSVEDLRTFGGATTKLKIRVEQYGPTLSFNFISNPQLLLNSSFDDEQAWATYGKVKSVFDRRRLRIKNALESLPEWLKWSLWISLSLSPLFFPHGQRLLYFVIGWTAVIVLVIYESYLHPSRVFFVRSHDRTRMSSEARRRNIREIIILVIGGVIGGLIIEGIHHLLSK
jgi:hypothetical protein